MLSKKKVKRNVSRFYLGEASYAWLCADTGVNFFESVKILLCAHFLLDQAF